MHQICDCSFIELHNVADRRRLISMAFGLGEEFENLYRNSHSGGCNREPDGARDNSTRKSNFEVHSTSKNPGIMWELKTRGQRAIKSGDEKPKSLLRSERVLNPPAVSFNIAQRYRTLAEIK